MTSRPVSLLLISHSYPPVHGGSQVEAQRMCAGLARRGHRVEVLCAGAPPMPNVARWTDPYGAPVRIFGRVASVRIRDYLFALGVAWTLWRERSHYDVAYFLMQGLHLATGLPIARLLGKPVVMKFSGSNMISETAQSRLGRLELRFLRWWARPIMILNDGMVAEALAAGLEKEQLLWMPNPVDTTEFAPCPPEQRASLRRRLGLPESSAVILYAGRLAPEKELVSLVDAFAAAVRRAPDAILALLGEGPERPTIESRARELAVADRVRLLGWQPGAAVREWMQASDIFALVSANEGLPCSLLEAMSAGLPSVVSSIPANLQLIDHGVHGLSAPVRDAEAIAAALGSLISNPEMRAVMGRAARLRAVENYSSEHVLDRYERLFAEALDRGGLAAAP